MKQNDVNRIVASILKRHIGRKKAIIFKNIAAPVLKIGATEWQVKEAIRILRCRKREISSRPNVGYYMDKSEMLGCKIWIENLRVSKGINPITPSSLKWVV